MYIFLRLNPSHHLLQLCGRFYFLLNFYFARLVPLRSDITFFLFQERPDREWQQQTVSGDKKTVKLIQHALNNKYPEKIKKTTTTH